MRTALGASRGALIRQLLTETVLMSIWTIALGIALGQLGTSLSRHPAGAVFRNWRRSRWISGCSRARWRFR